MKILLFVLGSMSFNAFAVAKYDCAGQNGESATLTLRNPTQIVWNEATHSADSDGTFLGVESAPFSPRKGQLLFDLVDFFRTEDSRSVLAVEPGILTGAPQVAVTTYFDNDDHIEDETAFRCRLLN